MSPMVRVFCVEAFRVTGWDIPSSLAALTQPRLREDKGRLQLQPDLTGLQVRVLLTKSDMTHRSIKHINHSGADCMLTC